jgi:hypothetical protein
MTKNTFDRLFSRLKKRTEWEEKAREGEARGTLKGCEDLGDSVQLPIEFLA